jgi:hypothetical protein
MVARYCCWVAALLVWGCHQTMTVLTPVDKTQINSGDLKITVTKDSMAADGVSTNVIQFTGDAHLDSFYSMVTFSIAPNGIFSNDSTQMTVPISAGGPTTVYAFSRVTGTGSVTATVNGVTAQTQTTFTTAWPDEVQITADSTFLTGLPGIWTGVTATLERSPGKVSPGIFVKFKDYDSTRMDTSLGIFKLPDVTDTSGKVTRQYWVVDTAYHGLVYIDGYVVIAPGDTIRQTTSLQMR